MNFFTTVFPENQDNLHRVDEFARLINSNSQSFLLNFPVLPLNKIIYGCYELNAQFNYGVTSDFDKNLFSKHEELPLGDHIVDILAEIQNQPHTASKTVGSNVNDRQPLLKRLFNKYMESGFVGVFEDINSMPKKNQIPEFVYHTAGVLINLIDIIYAPISPLLTTSREEESDVECVKGEQWKSSLVKAFQWHPYCNKYAVAFKTDLVKIYASSSTPQVVLRHQKQVNVTCIAWKPYYNSFIAVGCSKCIILWDTDVVPVSIKPPSSCSFVLSRRYHRDIVDIQWSEEFLLSVASKDNQIMIWDVTLKKCVPIKRVGTTGFSLARFSPKGFKLFTADLTTTFRCWNPINYTSEKWSNLIARCNAACWSPDENILLFSCENCPLLYSLRFIAKNKQELKIVCDLSSIVLSNNFNDGDETETSFSRNQQLSVGGAINDMSWDTSGQRLAITFKNYGTETNVNVVALFITKSHPQFQILPGGFISDMDNSWPASINFKPNFDQGALLTIGWSNSRIQHVPFYFGKMQDNYFN